MPTNHRRELVKIRRFDQLVAYLRDEMGWPIGSTDFEDLVFEYTPEELGIDPKNAAKIQEIKRLRPLSTKQPWGIFFVKFEPKRLPVVALRRILGQVALKKRASANSAERQAWETDDLLFISNYGEGQERQISFAHFSQSDERTDLPTLKVLGWDNLDTPLHLDHVGELLTERLAWPEDDEDGDEWRKKWRSAFTLRHREVIETSRELSERLAELARAIRDRIQTALAIETESGPLTTLMKAFQKSLVHDLDEGGFADMYAQTIAYGLLSSRITDPEKKTADDFAAHMRTNPFLKELMETFLHLGGRKGKAGGPGIDFDELGVSDVMELLDDANMEEVVRDFGDEKPEEDPIIHFYELFLQEYDAKKRMQRGVFYTPRPVVSFIVRSVDTLLRTEFGLEDGLADMTTWREMAERVDALEIPDGTAADQAFVQILDPATGTGTFLVEAIDIINKTMTEKWRAEGHSGKKVDQLWNEYVPQCLLPRLHGYELMMAPYAIAHMKIGLKLHETGYLFESDERARVYLTNSLEPAQDFLGSFDFAIPALAHEAKAVNTIKGNRRFTVVIGNPPYSGHSANTHKDDKGNLNFIGSLVHDYYFVDGIPLGEQNPKWLQDDYVKFLRFGQFLIRNSRIGVLAFISNNGYLDNPTFRGMRRNLMQTFSQVSILDLHGSIKKREISPDGQPDENVFDIQQGVGICFLSLKKESVGESETQIVQSDLYGSRKHKYDYLLSHDVATIDFLKLAPAPEFYLFVPQDQSERDAYEQGWKITDIFPMHSLGMVSARDDLCIQWTADDMWAVVRDFSSLPVEEARLKYTLRPDSRDWKVKLAQKDLLDSGPTRNQVVEVLYRPFDIRHTYFTGNSRGFICMPRGEVMRQMLDNNNLGLHCVRQTSIPAWQHILVSNRITDSDYVSNLTSERGYLFPLFRYPTEQEQALGITKDANLNPKFMAAVTQVLSEKPPNPEDVLWYLYGILHSPEYRSRYAEFLKIDFARIPIPGSSDVFRGIVQIGRHLGALHLMEAPNSNEQLITIVGTGNFGVEKVSHSDHTVWIDKAKTCGFQGVADEVWNFQIGGYQVCEKWLKDRQAKGGKKPRPARILTDEDIDHYKKILIAISETIRSMSEIDVLIETHGGWPNAFVKRSTDTESSSIEQDLDLPKAAEDPAEYGDS